MKKMFFKVSVFSFLLMFGITILQSEASAQTPKSLPRLMKWTTYDIGGIAYVTAAILADSISQKTGIKIRAIPCETDIARLTPLRAGDVMVAATGAGAYFSREGLAEFSDISWGPQPWQVLWQTQHPGAAVYVRRDSGIQTAADLRGKRITQIPGFPAVNFQMEGHLAFAGITWKDVKIVDCTSYADSCKAVIEGRADAAAIGTTSSYAYELEGTSHGIRYIPLPASDKEGWARLKKTLFGYAVPVTVTVGAGVSKDKPLETATYGYPILAVRPDLDEEVAYFLTKNVHENYPI